MKKYIILLGIALAGLPICSAARGRIFGRILNDSDGHPISNAMVFIHQSRIAAVSSDSGRYEFPEIPDGYYSVVAFAKGFSPMEYPAEIRQGSLSVVFRLSRPVKGNQPDEVPYGRRNLLEQFRHKFLCQPEQAKDYSILNEDAIKFEATGKENSLRAYAVDPLIILNRALGYKLFFLLKDFYFDAEADEENYSGYWFFEDHIADNQADSLKYLNARNLTYLGSPLHFFHSLIGNQLEQEGFSLLDYLPLNQKMGILTTAQIERERGNIRPLQVNGRDILHQDLKDSTGSGYFVSFHGQLVILYQSKDLRKLLNNMKGNSQPVRLSAEAYLQMRDSFAQIDSQGNLKNPADLWYGGDWANEQVANLLPLDYRPRLVLEK
jgi:hypothetical protein